MMEALLSVENLSKSFPGVKALDDMHFDLYPGEIHILAGENGAGKSTLSKCILGYLKPDAGRMYVCGHEVSFSSPGEALACGIHAVYQELTLVPWLNAAQNIFFNREPVYGRTGLIRRKKMMGDAREILNDLGCGEIDVSLPVCRLGIADRQMVEIARALAAGPRIIIFDEATAALTENQAETLFKKMENLKKQGVGMIYISHRLQEYGRIGDRITVMRDGRFIGSVKQGEISERELVHMMVGRDVRQLYVRSQNYPIERSDRGAADSEIRKCRDSRTEEVLRTESLCDREGKVKEVSLKLNRGEIVGIAGLVGAGRSELARLLFGVDRPGRGKVYLHGEDVTGRPPGLLIRKGLGLLPEDRKEEGLFLRASMKWNISAASLYRLFPDGLIRKRKEEEVSVSYRDRLKITASGIKAPVSSLSGGNQQKVVMAKWLLANTDIMIFDEPTRGIDVGAKEEIYRLMDRMAEDGKTILMISSELPELLGMCDRLYVMREGRVTGELSRSRFSEEKVGTMMMYGSGDYEKAKK